MSNKSNNSINIPQAWEAMDKFKKLLSVRGRHLTSREAGDLGARW